MDKLCMIGGGTLQGEIAISGAKNAALPQLCASLLTSDEVHLHNVPALKDVATMNRLLGNMGVILTVSGVASESPSQPQSITLQAPHDLQTIAPYEWVKTMRASILALGPLLARFGQAQVSLPGGCAIGSRPVDQHIKGLMAMGASIEVEHGYIMAHLPQGKTRLQGAHITTDMVTVTGTENLMMAACLAEGETILENAAQEPEITDLAEMLIKMGAQIEGAGTHRITIHGVPSLHGCHHQVVADRIEAGTFLCAVAATGGEVVLHHARADHLEAVIEKLRDAGVHITYNTNHEPQAWIKIHSQGGSQLKAQTFRTTEYPGFPTDMQAQFMALNCVAQGTSTITETIFENRFMHVNELVRLGAKIQTDGKLAIVEGGHRLSGADVMATDLRASAGLVIAGLCAEGQTVVDRIYHLDRGYDQMEVKLRALGANIRRIH